MKNLISCFALVASFTAFGQLFTQKDTLRFAADSSYSRKVVRKSDEILIFGTSKTGIVSYNEAKHQVNYSGAYYTDGEYRDIGISKSGCVYGMVSGENGHIERGCMLCLNPVSDDPGVFYDDLVMTKRGYIVLGDPVNNVFFMRYCLQHGTKPEYVLPKITSFPGEACYAGSGTTAQLMGKHDYCFVSGGGGKARFHRFSLKDTSTYFVRDLPLALGDGAGPFSVCFTDAKNGVAVGGNYTLPNEKSGTATYTTDGGKTWLPATTTPQGYRCSVVGNKTMLFCAGSNGIDYSLDGGITWQFFDRGYFCALLLEKNRLYATTNKGYCLRYELNLPD